MSGRGLKRTSSGASGARKSKGSSKFLGVFVPGAAQVDKSSSSSSSSSSISSSTTGSRRATASRSMSRSSSASSTGSRKRRKSEVPAEKESGTRKDEEESLGERDGIISDGLEDEEGNSVIPKSFVAYRHQSPTAPFKKRDKKMHEVATAGTTSSDEEVFRTLTKDLKLVQEQPHETGSMQDTDIAMHETPDRSSTTIAHEGPQSECTASTAATTVSSCASSASPPPVSDVQPARESASASPSSATKKTGIVIKLKLPSLVSPIATSSTPAPLPDTTDNGPKFKWSKEIACHQDKVRSDRPRMFCESPGCHHNYCERCIKTHYPDMAILFVPGGLWLCPACRDVCTCQRCRGIRAGTIRRPVPKKRTDIASLDGQTSPTAPTSSTTSTSSMLGPKKSRPGCERWMNTRGIAKKVLVSGAVRAASEEHEAAPRSAQDEWAPPQERWSDSESEEDEEWREWSQGRTKVVWHEGPERRRRRKTLENELALRAITEGKHFSPPRSRSADNLFVVDVDENAAFGDQAPAIEFEPAAQQQATESGALHASTVRLASPMPAVRVEDFIPPSPDSVDADTEQDADQEDADDMEVDDITTPPAVSAPENAANLEVTLMPPVLAAEPVATAAALDPQTGASSKVAVQSTPSKVLRYSLASPGKFVGSVPPPTYSEALRGDDPLIFAGSPSITSASLPGSHLQEDVTMIAEDDLASSSKSAFARADSLVAEGLRGVTDEMLGSAVRRALLGIEAERSAAMAAAAAASSALKTSQSKESSSDVQPKADVPSSVCENSLFTSGEVRFDDWILAQSRALGGPSASSSSGPASSLTTAALVEWDLQ